MDILFQEQKLAKVCNNQSLLIRAYGPLRAKLLQRRLDELKDVENLEAIRSISQARCHQLKGTREGTLSVDLDQPYRLVFEPAHNPIPRKPDGGLDWTKVTAIRVLSVENYHD